MLKFKPILIVVSLLLICLLITSCNKKEEPKKDITQAINEQNLSNIRQMTVKNNAITDWDLPLISKSNNSQPIFSLEVQNILQNHKQKAILFNELDLKDIYKENGKTFAIFQSSYDDLNLLFILEANQSAENKLLGYNYDFLDSLSIVVKLGDIKRKNNMNIEALPIDENSADINVDSGNILILYGELLDTYKYSYI